MKKSYHSEKGKSEIEVPVDASSLANPGCIDSVSKKHGLNVELSQMISDNHNTADRFRNHCLLILIFVLTVNAVFGKIRNGYEKNISASRQSLTILTNLPENENITSWQRRKTQSAIATLIDHVAYYELTEGLLMQFKATAPELYVQIDTITDRLGRPVDVFVRFVPVDGTSVKAWGLTNVKQSSDDKDAYQSEFGKFTVSVKIWIVRSALLVLAHELGHVKYQVPNLASYCEFYKKHYDPTPATNSMGHDIDDPSGRWANQFGRTFQKRYADFIKKSIDKVQNPLSVLARLKKNWSKNALSDRTTSTTYEIQNQLSVAVSPSKEMSWASVKSRLTGKSKFWFSEH